MLQLNGNTLLFNFPEVHPDAQLSISFERTCRIPDDGKTYPLPASLGRFPLRHVDDYRKRVPIDWDMRGGVMLPMYQSEAMWLHFKPKIVRDRRHAGSLKYPFAVKIAAGKQSAVTGDTWTKKLKKGDYLVCPPQQWLDGFVVEEGVIRQFVAMPLGMGVTVEEQLTGEAEWGGLQIEVLPMKRDEFERRFPKPPPSPLRGVEVWDGRIGGQLRRSRRALTAHSLSTAKGREVNYSCDSINVISDTSERWDSDDSVAVAADMGLGAGGTMKQDIKKDPYGKDAWQRKCDGRRCYIHLANSLAWRAITGEMPPTAPLTAKDYKKAGFPWFDLYEDGLDAVKAKSKLKSVQSVMQFGFQHGVPTLPENKSVKVKRVHMLRPEPAKGSEAAIREGDWA